MSRAKGFKFKAPQNARGRAAYTVPTVPARDLDERDVARLSEEQYAAVRDTKTPDGKLLYQPIKSRKSDKDNSDEVDGEEIAAVEVDEPVEADDSVE